MEEVTCLVKNNLAYYLAEKQALSQSLKAEEIELARECAEYIRERTTAHPDHSREFVGVVNQRNGTLLKPNTLV